MLPIGVGCGGLALRENMAAGCPFVDLRQAGYTACGIRQVRDLALRAIAPIGHHAVVDFGPEGCGFLHRIFPRHSDGAARSPPPAAFHLNIEGDKVGVGVLDVVAMLIMDGGNIPSGSLGEGFTKCPDKGLALLGRCLHG